LVFGLISQKSVVYESAIVQMSYSHSISLL